MAQSRPGTNRPPSNDELRDIEYQCTTRKRCGGKAGQDKAQNKAQDKTRGKRQNAYEATFKSPMRDAGGAAAAAPVPAPAAVVATPATAAASDAATDTAPPPTHEYNISGTLIPVRPPVGASAGAGAGPSVGGGDAEAPQDDRHDADETANFYEWRDVFPELEALARALPEITAECLQVASWKAWPEKHYEEGGGQDWKVRDGRVQLVLEQQSMLKLRVLAVPCMVVGGRWSVCWLWSVCGVDMRQNGMAAGWAIFADTLVKGT